MKKLGLLFGLLAGCASVEAKEPTATVSIDPSRSIGSLTEGERDQACGEMTARERRAFKDPVKIACEAKAVTEAWSAAIAATRQDKELSTAELQSICASTRKACLAKPDPVPEANCHFHELSSCDITVGEVLACNRDATQHYETVATQDLCALVSAEHPAAGLNTLTAPMAMPTCKVVLKRCVKA